MTNTNDSGAGSLRQAIADAAAGDTITIDSILNGLNITLASTLTLSKNVTIDGSGLSSQITLSGNNNVEVFYVNNGVSATLSSLNIVHGQGSSSGGGGVYNAGTLTVNNSTFSGNSALGLGGAIRNYGTLIVNNSTFSGNSGYGSGAISNPGTATIQNSTFSGNSDISVSYGGGGAIRSAGSLTIVNSTFSGNSANGGNGGAINAGNLTLINDTFSGNSSKTGGGGVSITGTATLKNNIFANNTVGGDCVGAIASSKNNLIMDAAHACGLTNGDANGNIIGVDPKLGALGNYGGATQTIPLLPGSPAIGAGDATTSAGLPGGNYDQHGESRFGACDIGSFESQGFTLGYTSGDSQSAKVNTAFTNPLVLSVTANNLVEPVNGGAVTFTAPSTGASASFSTNPVTISGGSASASATANGTVGGPYTVTASASGASSGVNFSLTNTPTVTYNANGGTGSVPTDNTLYHSGDTVNVLFTPLPTKTGYTFAGWNDGTTTYTSTGTTSFIMGSNNITLNAQWTAINYTVTYNGNGSDGGSVPTDGTNYNYGNTVNVLFTPLPTKTGYTFAGWNDGTTTYTSGGTTSFSMPASNVTLTAQWTAINYNVTYDGNGNDGGSVPTDSTNYNIGNTVNVLFTPLPTKTGYTFAGWNDGTTTYTSGGTTSFSMPASNVTLTAQWTAINYNVAYDGNGNDGGSVPTDNTLYHIGNTVNVLFTPLPTKTGYTFAGWNDGTTTYTLRRHHQLQHACQQCYPHGSVDCQLRNTHLRQCGRQFSG